MSSTSEQAKTAGITNKRKYGEDFYTRIGAMGGRKSRGGGVTGDPVRAAILGSMGGRKSKRGRAKVKDIIG